MNLLLQTLLGLFRSTKKEIEEGLVVLLLNYTIAALRLKHKEGQQRFMWFLCKANMSGEILKAGWVVSTIKAWLWIGLTLSLWVILDIISRLFCFGIVVHIVLLLPSLLTLAATVSYSIDSVLKRSKELIACIRREMSRAGSVLIWRVVGSKIDSERLIDSNSHKKALSKTVEWNEKEQELAIDTCLYQWIGRLNITASCKKCRYMNTDTM